MHPNTFTCPHCSQPIELTEALTHEIRESVRKEELPQIIAREKALAEKENELTSRAKDIEKTVSDKVASERTKLESELLTKLQSQVATEMTALQTQIQSKDKELEESKKLELKLRQERQSLEQEKANLELSVQRRLDEEREAIRRDAAKAIEEKHKLDEIKKDHTINVLREEVENLRKKIELGSQQAQGESLEVELENILKAAFPFDIIEPVAKGARGADCKQIVRNASGQVCGVILWESKQTKNWSDGWVQKLKDDALEAKADIGIILTAVLPKGIEYFGHLDGSIYVTNYSCLRGLALALRQGLLNVASVRLSEKYRQDTQALLFNYLTSQEFKNRMEAILGPFLTMQSDLDSEIRTTQTRWKKRQKQIERVISGISGFSGELEGILGNSFSQLNALDMKALPEGDEEEE